MARAAISAGRRGVALPALLLLQWAQAAAAPASRSPLRARADVAGHGLARVRGQPSDVALGAAAAGQIVDTAAGKVQGKVVQGCNVFRGVPFAAPPVAQNRWRGPQPLRAWSGVRQATSPGHQCPQFDVVKGFHIGE